MKSLVSVSAALILASAASAGARDSATVVMSDNPGLLNMENDWGFSDAIIVGDTVYLSGVVAGRKDAGEDLEASYTRAFERIGAILKRAGATWDDVVEITSFHTDVTTQMVPMKTVKNRYIRAPFPAWTAIQVVRLIPDNGITEIRLVAKLPVGLIPARR